MTDTSLENEGSAEFDWMPKPIHFQSWRTYMVTLQKSVMVRNFVVTISRGSLNALYFMRVNGYNPALLSNGAPPPTNVRSVAILTTTVQVSALGNTIGKGTYTEATADLLRS